MSKKKLRYSLSFRVIASIILTILVFGMLTSLIGYVRFTASMTREYNSAALRTAETAATLVNSDHIGLYLDSGGQNPEYLLSLQRMQILCEKQNVSLIYVIQVDTTDYAHFTSVFNTVHPSSGYTPWEIGYVRETTNESYREIYRSLYSRETEYATITRTRDLNGAPPHTTSMIPLKGADGTVRALLCVQRPMEQLQHMRRAYLWMVAGVTVLLAVGTSVTYSLFIRRQLLHPLQQIRAESVRFAQENSRNEKPLSESISKIDEIRTLAQSITQMETETLNYMSNLQSITAEKERIGTELSVASMIQESSIPNLFPAFPERTEFDIYASMSPAKEVGGDFYDFYLIDDDHLALVIADVSGKGVPAALFMMVTKILLKERAMMGGTPAEILEFVNSRICDNNRADMFVTVWFGILEISTGKITAANAGHDDPAVFRSGQGYTLHSEKHGLVIGAMQGMRYRNFEIDLEPGDKLFLYTDGVPEATNAQNQMFTLEQMLQSLNQTTRSNPEETLRKIRGDVDQFVGDAPQFDDLTMLCLKFGSAD